MTRPPGHVHILASIDTIGRRMGRKPVAHHPAAESHLTLECRVQRMFILAGMGTVDIVIGAHHSAKAGFDGTGVGPQVDLVQSTVVDFSRVLDVQGEHGHTGACLVLQCFCWFLGCTR